ncbi:MAG: hypothetical protein AAGL11_01025 [Pseudomonadota bacterium]
MSKFDILRTLSGWFWLMGRDAARLIPVGLLWFGLVYAFYSLDSSFGLPTGLFPILASMGVEPFLIGVCSWMALQDQNVSLQNAINHTIGRFWSVVFVYVLALLGTGLGFLFLIIPGLALSALWIVAMPVLLAEGKGPIDALRQSFIIVRKTFWPVFALVMILLVGAFILSVLLDFSTGGFDDTVPVFWLVSESLSSAAIGIMSAYLSVAIYRELTFDQKHDVSVFD